MRRLVAVLVVIFSSAAHAQIGIAPAERSLLPSPLIDPPLFASEVDGDSDRAMMLLHGDVESVDFRVHLVDENFEPREFAEMLLRFWFDACGNVERMEFGSEWEGEEEIRATYEIHCEYIKGCLRKSTRTVRTGGDQEEEHEGEFVYDENGRSVSAALLQQSVAFGRTDGTLTSHARTNRYGEDTVFKFDEESGRLSGIISNGESLAVEWNDDRTVRFGSDKPGVGWFEIQLDGNNRNQTVTVPEHARGMFGLRWERTYELDSFGNWTVMRLSVVQEEGMIRFSIRCTSAH